SVLHAELRLRLLAKQGLELGSHARRELASYAPRDDEVGDRAAARRVDGELARQRDDVGPAVLRGAHGEEVEAEVGVVGVRGGGSLDERGGDGAAAGGEEGGDRQEGRRGGARGGREGVTSTSAV